MLAKLVKSRYQTLLLECFFSSQSWVIKPKRDTASFSKCFLYKLLYVIDCESLFFKLDLAGHFFFMFFVFQIKSIKS